MLIQHVADDGCVTYPNLRKKSHVFKVTAMSDGESSDKIINFESKFSE